MLRPLLVLCLLAAPAAAKSTDDWLGGLTDRVIADLAAGKPLVVEVHVPLCESSIIACGNAKLGDGDTPETNLYWSTTPGFGGARAGRRRSERRRQDRSRLHGAIPGQGNDLRLRGRIIIRPD